MMSRLRDGSGWGYPARKHVKVLVRFFRFVLFAALLAGAAAAAGGWWWIGQPLPLRTPTVELEIEPGEAPRDIARGWVDAGVQAQPWMLYQWFRWSGQSKRIRAGSYEIAEGTTPRELLTKMVQGDEQLESVRLIEGWTFRQFRAELARTTTLKHDTATLTDDQIMAMLGAPGMSPEGRFFPDTYSFAKGSTESAVLKRAFRAMQRRLDAAWKERDADSPLTQPDQMLTLASIVEKETGQAADRGLIAGVFINRLRVGMPLQTDPTVIYGLGDKYDGNLHRRDLETDTPYNTYTRTGLPPTPISMPGRDSLRVAARPQPTKALYFVSRGDGTSQFSETLADHNRAVDKFQRRRGK